MAISTGQRAASRAAEQRRSAQRRHYIMTAPTFFAIDYAINPWMDTGDTPDVAVALAQWSELRDTYRRLGHTVEEVEPAAGLPDMVYAANAGLVIEDTAVIARFKHRQRAGEAGVYADWLRAHGYRTVYTRHINEGQGDLLLVAGMVLAGTGFRTAPEAHAEIAELLGLPVVSLQLIDPRFYHLDTALTVLDDHTIAYYPPAFSPAARARLAALFDDAIVVDRADADVLGLNAVSDGLHVVLPAAATGFAAQLRRAGFDPIGVDLSEMVKGGGAVKCCTLEVYR